MGCDLMFSREVIWQADLILLGVMTLAGLLAMWIDKTIARRNGVRVQRGTTAGRRTPARTPALWPIWGASRGVRGGMYLFRHKTKHKSFVFGVPVILAVQAALIWLLVAAAAG